MRFLDARTLQFKEINDPRTLPKYAILSHTWTDSEVIYSDLISSPGLAHQRPEFAKVKFTAQQALDDGLDHIWVDTCNIDKSSSAELSETINSMFMLYKKAEVCYVYLADITDLPPAGWTDDGLNDDAWTTTFADSRWFTRGWTLQELIAPRKSVFYTRDWKRIGTKRELCQTIARNTGIPSTILLGVDFGRTLVAERMNWAAKRRTTRVEDQAYCLLGLFDINMPLLYGEGERAFLRLQHEIIKKTNDRSIFLWTAPAEKSHTSFRSLFARSPAEFASYSDYGIPARYGRFEVTQSGLEINFPLIDVPGSTSEEVFGVIVDAGEGYHCVYLRKLGDGEYARVAAHKIARILNPNYNPFARTNPHEKSEWITVPNTFDKYSYECHMDYRLGGFHVEYYPIELQIHSVTPSYAWDEETKTLNLDWSESMRPIEDGLKIVFSEVAYPDTTFEVDLIEEMRSPSAFKSIGRSQSNEKYGYMARITQRFIGDQVMNVLRIDYVIEEEGKRESQHNYFMAQLLTYILQAA
jgi:hypothetical protein